MTKDALHSAIAAAAARHGFSPEAAERLFDSLSASGGAQASFNDPAFGGMGMWSSGGMIMIGDMFNYALKARVDGLATDLAALARAAPRASATHWWGGDFGPAAASGAQNATRYAFFPSARRLAVDIDGHVTVYDTGDHVITGVSQQQGDAQTLVFSSQAGPVRMSDLSPVGQAPSAAAAPANPGRSSAPGGPSAPAPAPPSASDAIAHIERLAELHKKGVLTDAEFAQKKADLLARI